MISNLLGNALRYTPAGGTITVAARGTEIFGVAPRVVSEIGPVIGTHVGPGLLGAGGLPSSYLAP